MSGTDHPAAAVPFDETTADADPTDAEFTVVLAPKDGEGVTVQLCRNDGPISREEQPLAFLSSGPKRVRVAGRLVRDSPTPGVDEDELLAGVKTALAQLDLQVDLDDEATADALRSPREQRLRNRTVEVETLRGGEETTYHVTMDPPTRSDDTDPQTLAFTNAQLSNQNPQVFTTEHRRAFGVGIRQSPDDSALTGEEWTGLLFYWEDIADVSDPGADVTTETAIAEFTSHIHHPLKVYDDERAFDQRAPTENRAFYVADYKGRGYEALVLPSVTVQSYLDDAKTTLSLSEFATALQHEGLMLGGTEKYHFNGAPKSVWLIDPAAVEWHPESNIHTLPDAERDANPTETESDAFDRTTPATDPRLGGEES